MTTQDQNDAVWENNITFPSRIGRIGELAYNLWVSWNPEARALFKQFDKRLWRQSRQNFVGLLKNMPPEKILAAAKDPSFLLTYDKIMLSFDEIMNGQGWFTNQFPDLNKNESIAYLSAEFGIHWSLPLYSGGLGILAGDHTKEASDLGIPLIGVGFMYPKGYFRQLIPAHGWQEAVYDKLSFDEAPVKPAVDKTGNPIKIAVDLENRSVIAEIWQVNIGKVKAYLLNTDVEENQPWDRELSARLYGGDSEMRIQQEIVLGIGGVKALEKLGVKPAVWHLNEGHPAFCVLERLKNYIQKDGLTFDTAREKIRQTTVFTTHTPVSAGHDRFYFTMVDKYLSTYYSALDLDRNNFLKLGTSTEHDNHFCMTVLAFKFAKFSNAVSKIHKNVTYDMWSDLFDIENIEIGSITNGVHLPTWIALPIQRLYSKYLGVNWLEQQDQPKLWERINDIPDKEFWTVHTTLKHELFNYIRSRVRNNWKQGEMDPILAVTSGTLLDPEVLTIGFARRFATYKRANLIFHDIKRIKKLLFDSEIPLQIIFAGKAHPQDDPGKNVLQNIYNICKDPATGGGRVAFLQDYDMLSARYLVAGVDVWLNNPLRPYEASGTSGMKAAMNGVPNLSLADGWWPEGYNGANGWIWGGDDDDLPRDKRDARDAQDLYRLLEEEVVPLYYQRDSDYIPRKWIQVCKEAMRTVSPRFSSRRMIKEYVGQMYVPVIRNNSG
ncbi:MAG: alpha-glucan family phosphorylase [Candidatus Hodarchaeota archaeon]